MSVETGSRPRILIVDDEAPLLRSFSAILKNDGISHVATCDDGRDVERLLDAAETGVVLLDLTMPHVSGVQILSAIRERHPGIVVVVVTAVNEVETAVECMKLGALDYLVKPVDQHRLLATVRRAMEIGDLRMENAQLRQRLLAPKLSHPEVFASMVTADDQMGSIFLYLEAISKSNQPVFITGETGVGKELVAQCVHRLSGRQGDLVTVNVAGVDDHVFADTFFGHVRGAYTGADGVRAGLAETAAGGTLFLDEIGDLGPEAQIKLLRFLQDGEYLPVGSDVRRHSDARIIASTNRDVSALLSQGKFREDLYFRLLAHHVRIPPLRERWGDLPLLVQHFLSEAATSLGKACPIAPKELVARLTAYSFPGNVRELRGMVYDAMGRYQSGPLPLEPFIDAIQERGFKSGAAGLRGGNSPAPAGWEPLAGPLPTLRELTKDAIRTALQRTQNNQVAAAKLLGISRQTMNRYARLLRLESAPVSE